MYVIVSRMICYELNGLGIISSESKISCTHPYQHWGPPRLLYSGIRSFPVVQDINHTLLSSAEAKERVELYFAPPLCLHGML